METLYELETFKVRLAISEPETTSARSSEEVIEILKPIFADLDADQEHFVVLLLNNKNRIRGYKVIASGSMTASLVHPAIVFRAAILYGAMALVVAHNHPSGAPDPSQEDIEITRTLKKCADVFSLRMLDHIVLGKDRYFSFSERGLLLEDSPMHAVFASAKPESVRRYIGSGRKMYEHSAAFLEKQRERERKNREAVKRS